MIHCNPWSTQWSSIAHTQWTAGDPSIDPLLLMWSTQWSTSPYDPLNGPSTGPLARWSTWVTESDPLWTWDSAVTDLESLYLVSMYLSVVIHTFNPEMVQNTNWKFQLISVEFTPKKLPSGNFFRSPREEDDDDDYFVFQNIFWSLLLWLQQYRLYFRQWNHWLCVGLLIKQPQIKGEDGGVFFPKCSLVHCIHELPTFAMILELTHNIFNESLLISSHQIITSKCCFSLKANPNISYLFIWFGSTAKPCAILRFLETYW